MTTQIPEPTDDRPDPDDEETLALSSPAEIPASRAPSRPDSAATIGASPDFAPDTPPPAVAHYRLIRELGQGGQGAVFLAEDLRLRRRVALKLLGEARARSPRSRERFRREAAIASRLDDPGLCTVFDAGEDDGFLYIAMRFVEGETLESRLKSGSAATPSSGGSTEDLQASSGEGRTDAWLSFFIEMLHALRVAHEAGLVHRDIKPANIMVTPEGRPVILDFGLARPDDEELATLTRSDDIVGTPAYMAPEQIETSVGAIDARTDVHAVGICLYEAITGRRPFLAATRDALYRSILNSAPPDPRSLGGRVPTDLRVVLDRALEKEPDRRYLDARAFADDLQAILDGRPIAARPVGTFGRVLRWARRRPGQATLVGLLALAILSAVGLGLYSLGRQPLVEQGRAARRQAKLDRTLERAFLLYGAGRRDTARALMEEAKVNGLIVPEAQALLASELTRRHRDEESLALLEANRGDTAGREGLDRVADFCRLRLQGTDSQEAMNATLRFEAQDHVDFLILSLRDEAMAAREYEGAAALAARHMLQSVLLAPRPRSHDFGRLAELAGRAGDTDLLALAERTLVRRWPESAVAHYWAGEGHRHAGALDRAREYLDAALKRDEELSPAWISLARVHYLQGRGNDADRALAVAEDLVPGDPLVARARGEMALARGDHEAARSAFEASIAGDEGHDDTWFNLGEARAQLGDYAGAITAFARAAAMDGDYGPYQAQLAAALVLAGRIDEAFPVLDHCARVDPAFSVRQARAWMEAGVSALPAHLLQCVRSTRADLVPAGGEDECLMLVAQLAAAGGRGRDALQLKKEGRRRFLGAAAELIDDIVTLDALSDAQDQRLRRHPEIRRLLGANPPEASETGGAERWETRRRDLRSLLGSK